MRRAFAALLLAMSMAAGCTVDGGGAPDPGPDAVAAAPDAGAPDQGADAAACAGGAPYMDSCATSDECDTCLCFTYGKGEKRCTQPCTSDDDCPAPSGGCNGMGVCKRPGG